MLELSLFSEKQMDRLLSKNVDISTAPIMDTLSQLMEQFVTYAHLDLVDSSESVFMYKAVEDKEPVVIVSQRVVLSPENVWVLELVTYDNMEKSYTLIADDYIVDGMIGYSLLSLCLDLILKTFNQQGKDMMTEGELTDTVNTSNQVVKIRRLTNQ